jgi:CheY-like chemotaxis protein
MDEKKLLYVVDDDPMITSLVVKRFTSDGYDVQAFASGEDVLDAIDRKPDLIILDYFFVNENREQMNGMEIFERIKKLDLEIPVIMLSGQDKGEIVLELARKGIDDYVIKDNNLIDNLQRAIGEYINRKK